MRAAIFSTLFVLTFTNLTWAKDPAQIPPILDLEAIDHSVDPCADFYHFACGQWLKDLQMPSDKSTYFHQFTALEDETLGRLRTLLETAPKDSHLGKFYSSCMNEEALESKSLPELQKIYSRIDDVKSKAQLAKILADLHLIGVNALFSFGVGQDLNDATRMIGFASQGGMALPEKDYYVLEDDKAVALKKEYISHISKILGMTGAVSENSAAAAKNVFELEYTLASASLALEDQGDPTQINHPIGIKGLKGLMPHFAWDVYFKELGVEDLSTLTNALNVNEPDFYKALDNVLEHRSLSEIKVYLKWQAAHWASPLMGKVIERESFNFWQGYLRGKKTNEPRWKRCVGVVGHSLVDELGVAYVGLLKGAEQTKSRTKELIAAVAEVFSKNLDSLDWLETSTIKSAREKLALVNNKVAYPEEWKSYEGLELDENSLLLNEINSALYDAKEDLEKIGQPVDRKEWAMAPWEVNAYYDPSLNEMVFPYGTLQPPVFDLTASDGANMGSLGFTIGHELTHGFDNDGSKFDGHGNVRNWWPEDIRQKFDERAQCLISQANRYEILPGLFVNGERTLTENIADQGGTKLAYAAFKEMASKREAAPRVGGYDEHQQFFLAYAQGWCAKRTDESMRLQIHADVHPPEEYRVNGVLMNLPEFAQTFRCQLGTRMAPRDRCAVW